MSEMEAAMRLADALLKFSTKDRERLLALLHAILARDP